MLSIYKKKITEQLCKDYCFGYVDDAKNEVMGMFDWVKNRIQKEVIENLNLYADLNKHYIKEIKDVLGILTDDKIKEILTCKPLVLREVWENEFMKYKKTKLTFKFTYNGKNKRKSVDLLYHIFNYESFRNSDSKKQYNGFLLSKKLEVDCCPYCNRNYITSHVRIDGKKVFPEFDHFYHKGDYPLLAISFYNLIPSCNVCNTHYKGKKDAFLENIFHPYFEITQNHFSFKFMPKTFKSLYGISDDFEIGFDYNSPEIEINTKMEKSINFFGIKEAYENCHSNLIKEIVNKKMTYSDRYLKIIEDTYGITFEESYRILFETYYEEDLLSKRPFSKLKKDIFDDVNLKAL